jgi:hypothetical protein
LVAQSLGSLTWTLNLSYCPSITYSLIDTTTGTTPDSIFSINSNVAYVNTNYLTKRGTYSLKVVGSLVGTYKTYATAQSSSFTVNVVNSC